MFFTEKKSSFTERKMDLETKWVEASDETEYAVTIFDDGNDAYARCPNAWRVSHTWKGKSRVVNIADPSVCISSISTWKLRRP